MFKLKDPFKKPTGPFKKELCFRALGFHITKLCYKVAIRNYDTIFCFGFRSYILKLKGPFEKPFIPVKKEICFQLSYIIHAHPHNNMLRLYKRAL